jgi:hypothetical protein
MDDCAIVPITRVAVEKGSQLMDILRNLTRKGLAAACLLGVFAAGSVNAATSNPVAPGLTSTGTVDVIYATNPAFDITISSLTPTAAVLFTATGQAVPGNTVDYTVDFSTAGDTDASTGGTPITEGVQLVGSNTTAVGVPPDCSTDNSAIYVTFAEAGNLATAPADTYRDQLTLLVEPN